MCEPSRSLWGLADVVVAAHVYVVGRVIHPRGSSKEVQRFVERFALLSCAVYRGVGLQKTALLFWSRGHAFEHPS